ncbi:Rrf2 family transcriptional regulator [Pseudonocardia alni]|uniref:Rrf2 family transcriptional regulator n=4 Tax=Pseudonocardia TaxID=1847 RepID=UPI000920487A|nr:iron-responsive transcriptional regulator [Pseudonocardia autotrophica]
MSAPATTGAVWSPEGTSRGTVVALPGRGEHPGLYARLGRRLAVDGWTLAVPGPRAGAGEVTDALAGATGARVLLGSDTGALRAWELAGTVRPDGLVLAGLPTGEPGAPPADRAGELDARTACPVHRGLLESDPDFTWGSLAQAPPPPPADPLPDAAVLWLHGDADPVAPVAGIRALARPGDDVAVVVDGVHDVLNDQFHRIVAARLVQFLERLAKGARFAEETPPAAAEPARPRRAAPLNVSARLDHALRALAELVAADGATVTCDAMARARGVPLNSLVNVMLALRRAGLVTSRRGCEGGYRLARPAGDITVADVVLATEGSIATLRSGPAAPLWADLERTVANFLTARTLTALEGDTR